MKNKKLILLPNDYNFIVSYTDENGVGYKALVTNEADERLPIKNMETGELYIDEDYGFDTLCEEIASGNYTVTEKVPLKPNQYSTKYYVGIREVPVTLSSDLDIEALMAGLHFHKVEVLSDFDDRVAVTFDNQASDFELITGEGNNDDLIYYIIDYSKEALVDLIMNQLMKSLVKVTSTTKTDSGLEKSFIGVLDGESIEFAGEVINDINNTNKWIVNHVTPLFLHDSASSPKFEDSLLEVDSYDQLLLYFENDFYSDFNKETFEYENFGFLRIYNDQVWCINKSETIMKVIKGNHDYNLNSYFK